MDLEGTFNGTLNIDIRPATFELVRPEYTFLDVRWTDLHPPEHFSFCRCKVIHQGKEYEGWIYYPHPETKIRNFQNPSLIEVIAPLIPEIKMGEAIEVVVDPERVRLGGAGSTDAIGVG